MKVGGWAEDKYRMVALYDELFSSGMRKKWETRVYIDLYSGPGYVQVRGTNRILKASPMLALGVPDQFDKYIFCEKDKEYLEALQTRVNRYFPDANVSYIPGDCNAEVEKICAEIPAASRDRRVLSFCFVDPFDISVKFSTIRRLSAFFIDFLVLLALDMDAIRNLTHYLNPANLKVEEFLGVSDWRLRWGAAERNGVDFRKFLALQYAEQMKLLGYKDTPLSLMKLVRSDDRNRPLYRLALFSRHDLAYKFWDQVLRYSTDQTTLDFQG